jgi:hypothetical protein
MTENVVELKPGTSTPLREREVVDVEKVLDRTREVGCTEIVLVGRDRQGGLYIAASHSSDHSLALLARASTYLAYATDVGIIPREPPAS